MTEDPSALSPGTLLAGRFRVVRCLGMGGMGAVYEIEHELTKHRRALKMLHASMAAMPGVVERFLREASAAGRVGNPHIVETFDAGTLDTGEPYLVMEILRGETLSDRIARGPMPVAEVVDLLGQACEGVQAAHEAGIVHRDLKPDNLFILDVDGHSFVKILDFGISKFDPGKTGGMALTQEGAALGTPYYMSPEQIRGETNLDARADVYALGVILYECLAGQRPFEADALTQLAVLIHTGKPTPLPEHRQDLPPGLADLVARAMATDRNVRTPSAAGLRAELEQFGTISFRGRATAASAPSRVPATLPAGAKAMATSAAGVSVRSAQLPAKKGQLGPVLAGFGVLGVLAVAGLVALRPSSTPSAEVPSAGVPAAVAPPPAVPAAEKPREPEVPAASVAPPPAPEVAAAASSKVLPPAPKATGPFPVVAPTLQPPPPPPVAAPPPGPVAAAAPAAPATAAPAKPKRTQEKGLAKDNPFR